MTQVKQISSPSSDAVREVQQSCAGCQIRERAVCAQCDGDELADLEGMKFYRSFEAGQAVVWSGDRMDFVASVVNGVASLTQTLDDGRTQMVGLLLPSDFLGRPGREQAPYTVTAITEVTLCCFRRRPFEQFMSRTPAVAGRLLAMTLDELDAAREWLLLLGRKSARERIASFLVVIARREAALRKTPPRGRMSFDVPLTREAMADYLGLTLETVSRQMSALKREGLIALEGSRHVTVPDFAALVLESGGDDDGGPLS